MRLQLGISVKYDLELFEKGIVLPTIRLVTSIVFKCKERWSDPYDAIIDTGSPVSVFPSSVISEGCNFHPIEETKIQGLVPHPECSLAAKLGTITNRVNDHKYISPPLLMKVYIAATNKIPFLLGFADLLERGQLSVNYSKREAHLVVS